LKVITGPVNGLHAVADVDFLINVVDVCFDSMHTQAQVAGNISIFCASSNQVQYLNFPGGQQAITFSLARD
jgi:hypothetical protein